MKIVYLILAHNNPTLIKKMIETLNCEDSSFFLHIDNKSNISEFRSIQGKNIFFTKERVSVYWAEYSMIEAILILIQQALSSTQDYAYYVLLSGSDYPLRSKEYIHNYFNQRQGTEFISIAKVPNAEAGLSLSKINTLSISSDKPICRFIVRICTKLGLAQRDYKKHLGVLQPYGGSTWWALTTDACQYILDFVKQNNLICKYFEKTPTSDETFFHTILGNSPFKPNIQRSLMYDDWSAGPLHPATINSNHLEIFEAHEEVSINDAFGPGELLFARKFSDENLEIVQSIDEMIKRKDLKFGSGKAIVNPENRTAV